MSDQNENKKPTRARSKKVAIEEIFNEPAVVEQVLEEIVPEVAKAFNPLRNERVTIKPIRREDGFMPKGHEGNFLFKDAYWELSAPVSGSTGNIMTPLDDRETVFFENINYSHIHKLSYGKGDLSPNKKTDNVWWTNSGDFSFKLKNENKILDLSDATQYIMYKLLLANTDYIAPDGDAGTPGNIGHKATFKFKIEREGFEDSKRASSADKRKLAYRYFGKMEEDRDAMITVLSFASPGERVPASTKIDTLISGIDRLIETRIDTFIDIVSSEFFDKKVFLYKALKSGFLIKESNKIYTPGGEEYLGRTLNEAAEYLTDPANQGVFIEISNKLRALD